MCRRQQIDVTLQISWKIWRISDITHPPPATTPCSSAAADTDSGRPPAVGFYFHLHDYNSVTLLTPSWIYLSIFNCNQVEFIEKTLFQCTCCVMFIFWFGIFNLMMILLEHYGLAVFVSVKEWIVMIPWLFLKLSQLVKMFTLCRYP